MLCVGKCRENYLPTQGLVRYFSAFTSLQTLSIHIVNVDVLSISIYNALIYLIVWYCVIATQMLSVHQS